MSSKKTLIAFITGATLGAVASILLAPASGKDTRKNLMKKASGLRENLTDMFNRGGALANDAKGAAKTAASKASKAAHQTMDGASSSHAHSTGTDTKA